MQLSVIETLLEYHSRIKRSSKSICPFSGCRLANLAARNNWCQKWDLCAARKGSQKRPRSPLQLYNVGAPMECIAIDILGPLPKSDAGNKYLLITMDNFSKWPEGQKVVFLVLLIFQILFRINLVSVIKCYWHVRQNKLE